MTKNAFFRAALLLLFGYGVVAAQMNKPPRLIVGIVVDQMRYDYLTRYWNRFGDGGFKQLVNQGYFCRNTHYNYTPTETGPGHASIYTGTTPAAHGIIANNWFERAENSEVYCASDPRFKTVGAISTGGHMSPHRMLTTTITDELRLATNMQSKVVGLSMKDRGAIFPSGHFPNGAYWIDPLTGRFITSEYYMNELPQWVKQFNERGLPEKYLSQPWETLYDIKTYTASWGDTSQYEKPFPSEKACVFPHDLTKILEARKNDIKTKGEAYDMIKGLPAGNTLLREMAQAAIEGEGLGADATPDFLTVSFSATDYISHQTTPRSVETEDLYLRLDKELALFLSYLDTKVGKGQYVLFLTADHGGGQQPAYLKTWGVPAGNNASKPLDAQLASHLNKTFGREADSSAWFKDYPMGYYYIDAAVAKAHNAKLADVQREVGEFLLQHSDAFVDYATAEQLSQNEYTRGPKSQAQAGFLRKRSADVIMIAAPHWMEYSTQGTTHGSSYTYDTHVPLLWYGWRIQHGETHTPYVIPDIAPTVSALLNINFPSGCSGKPVSLPLK